jgi:hypothetical protein
LLAEAEGRSALDGVLGRLKTGAPGGWPFSHGCARRGVTAVDRRRAVAGECPADGLPRRVRHPSLRPHGTHCLAGEHAPAGALRAPLKTLPLKTLPLKTLEILIIGSTAHPGTSHVALPTHADLASRHPATRGLDKRSVYVASTSGRGRAAQPTAASYGALEVRHRCARHCACTAPGFRQRSCEPRYLGNAGADGPRGHRLGPLPIVL